MSTTATLNARLDQAEERLPTLPARWLHLNRVITERSLAQTRRNNELVVDAFQSVGRVASNGAATVIGTARSAAEKTMSVASTGVRQVTGQAEAQAKRTASTIEDEATGLADEAIERTDEAIERAEARAERADRAHLRSLSKAELYDQAQDLDIDGRSAMSKRQLIDALVLDLDARR